MNKYPNRMAGVLKKHNVTIKTKNVDVEINTNSNYFNDALCKMSKSIFFNHEISYCTKDNLDEFSKKM